MNRNIYNRTVYKLVLTGGPCGGKTTGQDRLATFFENMGWKVFRVPETATVLLRGGIKFDELTPEQSFQFQENLLKTMMQIETVYFQLAANMHQKNCLIICDRGTMDPSAYMSAENWDLLLKKLDLNVVDLRDNRYDQVNTKKRSCTAAENV